MDLSMLPNLGSAFAELWSGIEVRGSIELAEAERTPDFVELLKFNHELQSTISEGPHTERPKIEPAVSKMKHWASL